MQTFRKLLDQQGFEGGWRGDLADQGVFFKTSAQRRKPCTVYGCFRSLRILLGRSWRVQFYEQRPRATVETLRLCRSCSVHVSNQRTNSAFLSRCGFWLVKLCRSRRCHCPDEFASVRPFCQPSQIRDSGPIVVPPPAPALKGLCSLSLMRAESNTVVGAFQKLIFGLFFGGTLEHKRHRLKTRFGVVNPLEQIISVF